MNVKEFRIGNILYVIEGKGERIISTVSNIREDGNITVSYRGIKSKAKIQFEPVKLTEEILYKCGLGRYPQDNTMYFFPEVSGTYFLKEEDGRYSFCIDDCGKLIHTMRPFEYLHQLQNAFFVTYCKELKIPFLL